MQIEQEFEFEARIKQRERERDSERERKTGIIMARWKCLFCTKQIQAHIQPYQHHHHHQHYYNHLSNVYARSKKTTTRELIDIRILMVSKFYCEPVASISTPSCVYAYTDVFVRVSE